MVRFLKMKRQLGVVHSSNYKQDLKTISSNPSKKARLETRFSAFYIILVHNRLKQQQTLGLKKEASVEVPITAVPQMTT